MTVISDGRYVPVDIICESQVDRYPMKRRGSSAEYSFANVLDNIQMKVGITILKVNISHEGPSVLISIKRCKGVNGAVSKTPLFIRAFVSI
jgi:hypothetical protein